MKNTKIYQKLKRLYNRWVWRNLPPCKEIVKKLSASLDRKLPVKERIIIKLHLAACTPCVRFLDQIEFLRDALHLHDQEIAEEIPMPAMSSEARERLKKALKSSIKN